jgi:YYY domain-containing protein
MLIVVVWWFWMQVMGLAALPLAYRFFRRLPDRGYALARPLGLLLVSYVLWLGGSLGFLRNSVGGILFSLGLVAAISVFYYRRRREEEGPGLLAWLRSHGRMVLSVELLFAGALGLWALLRAYSPDLTTAGGEKFMEIMYLNSIGRSDYFPPHDAWLSGYGISYYYFGYVMMAALTRLSGLPAHLTFNVGVASLFALTCTGAFSIAYNLVKRAEKVVLTKAKPIAWGLLGTVLVTIMGNLQGFLEVLYSARLLPQGFWQWLDIQDINVPFDPNLAPSLTPTRSSWWWWRSSRVIHDLDPLGNSIGIQPIDEFPAFSFLLGDMHPHVLALPFVLLALAIAFNALLEQTEDQGDSPAGRSWLEPVMRLPLLVPLCLGALGFLNTWDFPIYWLLFVAAYGLGRWRRYGQMNWPFIRDLAVTGGAVAVAGIALYLPFYLGFQSQAGGILPALYVGTRFRQYWVMFGPLLVAITGLLVILCLHVKDRVPARRLAGRWLGWTAAFLLLPLALMLLIVLFMLLVPQGREFLEGIRHVPFIYEIAGEDPWLAVVGRLLLVKLRTWVMPLIVAGLAALGTVLLQYGLSSTQSGVASETEGQTPAGEETQEKESVLQQPSVRLALLFVVTGLLLTLSVEFVYLDDVFKVRMNTIFKFYFQAWVLMAVASVFAIYWLSRKYSLLRTAFGFGFWVLLAMGMFFPILGNISRAGNFDHAPNLDGTAYLALGQADDYAAIAWLNENVEGRPVILEAPGTGGSSYVYEGRVSALTGLPTLLGWAGHENQWRGSYEVQSAREPDIETIYNTLDAEQALTLMDKYDITYVYVGPLERSKYEPRALEKFGRFLDTVYTQGGVTIYRLDSAR